jgi:signal transduction histidine kinase
VCSSDLAELAGGTLQILSTLGKGTRVQVRVPLQADAVAETPA